MYWLIESFSLNKNITNGVKYDKSFILDRFQYYLLYWLVTPKKNKMISDEVDGFDVLYNHLYRYYKPHQSPSYPAV